MRSAIERNATEASSSGLRDDDRVAVVAAGAQLGHERHLAEQRHLELVGELLAAAFAEQAIRRVVIAAEPRHVLDHTHHLEVDLARHVGGALRDLLRGGLRRGDDHDLARGRNCAIESAMSPVPGGMSTTR